MWLVILILTFASVSLLGWISFPPVVDRFTGMQRRRSKDLTEQMDNIFIRVKAQKITILYTLSPIIFGVIGYLLFPEELRLIGIIAGVAIGFLGPGVYIKILTKKRRSKFEDQLVDALMLLSSSLKSGLSIIQAIEVVVEEMPEPINQEFSILLGENKMGVSLEDAFSHLQERMPSTALRQTITAILLARETGGNLPVVFSRIVITIRENKKIRQNIETLTLQGKIQGGVMALLPITFGAIVLSTNPHFFDSMLNSNIGKGLLTYAVISEAIGAFLIIRISTFKEF